MTHDITVLTISQCNVTGRLGGLLIIRSNFFFFFFFAHFHFPASGQAVVTGVIPSPPRFLPSIFIAHWVQQSHCSSIVHRVLLTHALALSASQFVHKKKSRCSLFVQPAEVPPSDSFVPVRNACCVVYSLRKQFCLGQHLRTCTQCLLRSVFTARKNQG